jgi:hypothetical protein
MKTHYNTARSHQGIAHPRRLTSENPQVSVSGRAYQVSGSSPWTSRYLRPPAFVPPGNSGSAHALTLTLLNRGSSETFAGAQTQRRLVAPLTQRCREPKAGG